MPERKPKYNGLGQAQTKCQRIPGGRGSRLCMTFPETPGPRISSPDEACELLRGPASRADRESFYAIALSSANEVLGIEETSRGSLTGVEVHPREVFKSALLANAAAIVVAHNHPSGDASPSADDEALTRRLVKAGKLLGVPVLDHLIIGRRGCASMYALHKRMFSQTDEDYE